MLVSVITPCYNAGPFLRQTIDAISEQTYPDIEHIVLDDGSTDNSWDIIQSYGDKIKGARLDHMGASHARNYGAHLAAGRFLMFLDADDLISPDTLESLVATLEQQAYAVAACKWYRLMRKGDDWVKVPSGLSLKPADNDYLRGWLSGWYIPPCSILWSREAYERTQGWDQELTVNDDGDLMMHALLQGVRILMAKDGEAYYRYYGTSRLSLSNNIASKRALESQMRVLEKVTAKLERAGALASYAVHIGIAYHNLARNGFEGNVNLARECVKRAQLLAGPNAISGTWTHRVLCRLIGVEHKEQFARALATIKITTQERIKSTQLRRLANLP